MKLFWHGAWIASLLLALGIVSVWCVGPWWTFALIHRTSGWMDAALLCEDGHAYLIWADLGTPSLIAPSISNGFTETSDGSWWDKPTIASGRVLVNFIGIHFVQPARQGGLNWWVCPLPYPLILCLFAPLWQVWRWRRKRLSVKAGYCPRCGYDLRATPDTCPECGYEPRTPRGTLSEVTT